MKYYAIYKMQKLNENDYLAELVCFVENEEVAKHICKHNFNFEYTEKDTKED